MRKVIFVIAFVLSALNLNISVNAMVLHEITGNIIKGQPVFDSANNRYIVTFDPTNVDKIYMASFTDNTFSQVAKEKTWTDTSERPFNGKTYFTCGVAYKAIYFDKNDTPLGEIRFEADEVVNGSCDSGNGDDQLEEPGNSSSSCAAAVCECIEELGNSLGGAMNNVANSINDSINNNGNKLDNVNNNLETTNSNLNDLKVITSDIRDELKTDMGINEPQEVPVPPIISDGVLEDNMPKDSNKPFEDNNNYFKDKGDAEVPGSLPKAPEPVDCWTNVGTVCREDDLKKEDQLNQDKFDKEDELQKDKFDKEDELQKDKFDKEDELQKDKFDKEDELQKGKFDKEDEMKKDTFDKEDEMKKDKFDSNEIYNQTNHMNRDNFYEQTW